MNPKSKGAEEEGNGKRGYIIHNNQRNKQKLLCNGNLGERYVYPTFWFVSLSALVEGCRYDTPKMLHWIWSMSRDLSYDQTGELNVRY